MTAKRTRANGEGSIFPYRNGYAAYAWVTKPDGRRARKYVYGKTGRSSTKSGSSYTRRPRPVRSRPRCRLLPSTSRGG